MKNLCSGLFLQNICRLSISLLQTRFHSSFHQSALKFSYSNSFTAKLLPESYTCLRSYIKQLRRSLGTTKVVSRDKELLLEMTLGGKSFRACKMTFSSGISAESFLHLQFFRHPDYLIREPHVFWTCVNEKFFETAEIQLLKEKSYPATWSDASRYIFLLGKNESLLSFFLKAKCLHNSLFTIEAFGLARQH